MVRSGVWVGIRVRVRVWVGIRVRVRVRVRIGLELELELGRGRGIGLVGTSKMPPVKQNLFQDCTAPLLKERFICWYFFL